jgi:protein-S-isoprenylcysteine O-methyltransferase Ste14
VDSVLLRSGAFLVVTIFFTVVSWRPLHNPRSHGFYRYFAFVGITALVLYNQPVWFNRPFSPLHILSWLMLFVSVLLVINSVGLLKKFGGRGERRAVPENLSFENTQNLVVDGLYRYIRHPMYTSLLLLGWGAFLKQIDLLTVIAVVIVTGAIFLTAKMEERENIEFFGDDYVNYKHISKMFIPYLF